MGLTMIPEQQQQRLGFGLPGVNPMGSNMNNFGAPVPVMGNPANISMPAPMSASPTGTMGMTTGTPLSTGRASLLPPGSGGVPGADVAAGGGGWFEGIGGLEGVGSIASGLGQLGQVYGALQGVKLAKDQLEFSKDSYQTNLTNQTQSYNTALEDRIRARAAATGDNAATVDSYLKKHSL